MRPDQGSEPHGARDRGSFILEKQQLTGDPRRARASRRAELTAPGGVQVRCLGRAGWAL